GEQYAKHDAKHTANGGHRGGFNQELQQDVAAARANGFADAALAGSLGDGHQHDVHDDDAADDQGDGGDADHHDEERSTDVLPQFEKGVGRLDREVVFGGIGQMMAAAHDLANFIDAGLDVGGSPGANGHPERILLIA